MKALLLITMLFAGAALAADPTLPREITTIKGKTYTGVVFRGAEPDGIKIMHDGGAAKIPMEDLPEALRAQFNFDAKKAERFRKEQATAQKNEERKIAAFVKKRDKEVADSVKRAKEKESAAAANTPPPETGASAAPPAPMTGRTYTVTEVAAEKVSLKGKVFRIRLFYNTASAPEQQDDGSLRMFVTGSGSYDFVTFPPEGAAYIRTFLKSNLGQMTFYAALFEDVGIGIVGRGYDTQKHVYTW
jgi:hypothetical protein